MLGGVRIIESVHMVDVVEDWSHVRSPSRAARRRKKHRQNIRVLHVPKKEAVTMDAGRTLIMHPEIAREFRRLAAQQEPLGQKFSQVLYDNAWALYAR
jgi:hypothetical protein